MGQQSKIEQQQTQAKSVIHKPCRELKKGNQDNA